MKSLQAEVVLLNAERDKLAQELKRTPELIQASLSELQQQRMYININLNIFWRYTILPKVSGHPLLMKGLSTLVISIINKLQIIFNHIMKF